MRRLTSVVVLVTTLSNLSANDKMPQPVRLPNQSVLSEAKRPMTERDNGFYLDYLLMRASNSNLALAFEKKRIYSPGSVPESSVIEGEKVNPNITWRPGFRIGFQYERPLHAWKMQTSWTYYYNKSVTSQAMPDIWLTSANQNDEEGFFPYWALPLQDNVSGVVGEVAPAYYQNLRGVWQLNYNVIDWNIGKNVWASKTLKISPYFGIKTAWIHQKLSVLYERSFFDSTPAGDIARDQMSKLHNNFWGMGLSLGADGSWDLGLGFDFIAKISGSVLAGTTRVRRTQLTDFQGSRNFLKVYNVTNNHSVYSPGICSSIGLNWGTEYSNSTKYFGFAVAWEGSYWWNQFDFTHPQTPVLPLSTLAEVYREQYPFTTGALYIEGITVRSTWNF